MSKSMIPTTDKAVTDHDMHKEGHLLVTFYDCIEYGSSSVSMIDVYNGRWITDDFLDSHRYIKSCKGLQDFKSTEPTMNIIEPEVDAQDRSSDNLSEIFYEVMEPLDFNVMEEVRTEHAVDTHKTTDRAFGNPREEYQRSRHVIYSSNQRHSACSSELDLQYQHAYLSSHNLKHTVTKTSFNNFSLRSDQDSPDRDSEIPDVQIHSVSIRNNPTGHQTRDFGEAPSINSSFGHRRQQLFLLGTQSNEAPGVLHGIDIATNFVSSAIPFDEGEYFSNLTDDLKAKSRGIFLSFEGEPRGERSSVPKVNVNCNANHERMYTSGVNGDRRHGGERCVHNSALLYRLQRVQDARKRLARKANTLITWHLTQLFLLLFLFLYACACQCSFRSTFYCSKQCSLREVAPRKSGNHCKRRKFW